jgi:phage I-like protein
MQDQVNETSRTEAPDVERVALEASSLNGADVPNRIMITPWGEVESSTGSFVVDQEAASLTIAAFARHGTDLPVDYEHQTLGGSFSSPTGQAPAAGWIKALSAVSPAEAGSEGRPVEPGLWAEVEWTDDAKDKLRGRQYRYLSPVALVRRSDRRLVGIHSAALTNKPAIVGMRAVVSSNTNEALATAPASPATDLRGLLGMDEGAGEEIVLLAAAERIRILEQAEVLRQASERVTRAMSAGKLTAAQRDWAMSLAQRDPEEFDRWEAAAPVLVLLGRLAPPRADATDAAGSARQAAESKARAQWRAHRDFLEKLCTEEAYVADALREQAP